MKYFMTLLIAVFGLQHAVAADYIPKESFKIEERDGNAVPFHKDGLFGLADSTGRVIVPAKYNVVKKLADNVFGVSLFRNGVALGTAITLKGVVLNEVGKCRSNVPVKIMGTNRVVTTDQKGKFEIAAMIGEILEVEGYLEQITTAYATICPVPGYSRLTPKNTVFGCVDGLGNELLPIKYTCVESYVETDDLLYLTDTAGHHSIYSVKANIICDAVYSVPKGENRENVFVVGENGRYKLVSQENKTILPLEYDAIALAGSDRFMVRKGSKCGIFSVNQNKLIVPMEFDSIGNTAPDAAVVRKGSKCGIYSVKKNKLTVPVVYDQINVYSLDAAVVRKGSKYGIYSVRKNKLTVPVVYDQIETKNVWNGCGGNTADNKKLIWRGYYGFELPRSMEWDGQCSDHYCGFEASKGGKKYMISCNGEAVIKDIKSFREIDDAFVLVTNSSDFQGVFDHNGNVVIPFLSSSNYKIEYKPPFFFICDNNAIKGVYLQNGKQILPEGKYKYHYTTIKDLNYSYSKQPNGEVHAARCFTAEDEVGRKGVCSLKGKILVPVKYADVDYDDVAQCFIVEDKVGKMGVCSLNGKMLVPVKYADVVYHVGAQCFIVEDKVGKMGVCSLNGKMLVPVKYADVDYDEDAQCFIVEDEGGRKGVYSLNGKMVVPVKYYYVNFDKELQSFIVKEN